MPLPPIRFLVLDTETTGFVPKVHRVMEVACVAIDKGDRTEELTELLSLPEGIEIPTAIQKLTHIKQEDLNGRPSFEEVLPRLEKLLTDDTVIVGQNVQFDLGMLRGEGWDLTARPWIDTSMIASLVFPELESYSLGFMSDALGLDHTPRHRALGDVHATLQLLEKCTDRLLQLPEEDLAILRDLAMKSSEGYKRYFEALPVSPAKKRPTWITFSARPVSPDTEPVAFSPPKKGAVQLVEEPLDPMFLPSVVAGLSGTTWVAVKNLEAAVRRMAMPKGMSVLYPPEFVLSVEKVKALLAHDTFSADEMTIAMKLSLYEPTIRTDIPMHGGEYQVWAGKLGCTKNDKEYKSALKKALTGTAIVSHQQLLAIAADADIDFPSSLSIIVDDASMLEDTATTAFGWTCYVPTVRAAAQGNDILTKCADIIELWVERTRNGLDLRYLAPSDLESREASELKNTIADVLKGELLSAPRAALEHLLLILAPENLRGRITWIESFIDGSKSIKSVPENVAIPLRDTLYSRASTTLLIPPGSGATLRQILPDDVKTSVQPASGSSPISVETPVGLTVESLVQSVTGKTILLVSSKRTIEDLYVRHTEAFDASGKRIICQGFSGGQGRMQAEFELATEPALLVMTPWMYEGMELPPAMVSTLIVQVMPFDHPNHAVVSRRALRLGDPFNEYSLPRLKHRLFRLLRTFAKHAASEGRAMFLDERLRTKAYGKGVAKYLLEFGKSDERLPDFAKASPGKAVSGKPAVAPEPKKKAVKKELPEKPEAPQLSLL